MKVSYFNRESLKKELKKLPSRCGVYLMKDKTGKILYIGKARSIKNRVSSYFIKTPTDAKTNLLMSLVSNIEYLMTNSEKEALIWESRLIKKFLPKYNIDWKDNKNYPYLKLILSDDFPRLVITRKKESAKERYFGPYPDGMHLRKNLHLIKRIFPIRSCKNSKLPNKACLSYYIQRCEAPCIDKVSKVKYRKMIGDVILFLEGKKRELLKHLDSQMYKASNKLNFEEAKRIKEEIDGIKNISQKVRIRHIQENEFHNKLDKIDILAEASKVLGLKKSPSRIEAFDISNIGGKQAVGSMVVFENGEANKNEYRRFKIKTVFQADDYAMLKEVILRRYKKILSENNKLPDLVLIDGGKGQLNVCRGIMNDLGIRDIFLISLVKEKEHIFLVDKKEPLILPKESKVLHLFQNIRDEAHRFAISYHRFLRRKETRPA